MNDGFVYREVIGPRAVGRALALYLAQTYPHASLTEWRGHVAAGRVRLNGARVGADTLLRSAQVLTWHRPPWEEPDAPLAFAVLYEDEAVLAVAKPGGLPTMAGGGFQQHTLVHQLGLFYETAAPMHRLGRWTSGVVLCGRTRAASADLAAQFAARSIDKRYRALASGRPTTDRFDVEVPIGPVPYPPLGTLHAASPHGRPASSTVTVVEQRASAFVCDVTIATGRPHQIRIHLAAVGHPLVGDPLYGIDGQPNPGGTALPGDPGYLLHAAEIAFDHPTTGARTRISAPLPAALRVDPVGN